MEAAPSETASTSMRPTSSTESCSFRRCERRGRQAERQSGHSDKIAKHSMTFHSVCPAAAPTTVGITKMWDRATPNTLVQKTHLRELSGAQPLRRTLLSLLLADSSLDLALMTRAEAFLPRLCGHA